MLKNKKSEISIALSSMATTRRIVLTGTPLQNNLFEFHRMADWIRPSCLGTELEFDKKFATKIMSSLTSDSSAESQEQGEKLLAELFEIVSPYIQRLDSTVLKRDLPPMQQAVIHVRQTKTQHALYRAFKYKKNHSNNNFLEQYSKLFPVGNHPGALLFRGSTTVTPTQQIKDNTNRKKEKECLLSISNSVPLQDVKRGLKIKLESIDTKPTANLSARDERYKSQKTGVIIIEDSSDEENEEEISPEPVEPSIDPIIEGDQTKVWWKNVHERIPNLGDIENGGKAILLLQILAHSELIGECYKHVLFVSSNGRNKPSTHNVHYYNHTQGIKSSSLLNA